VSAASVTENPTLLAVGARADEHRTTVLAVPGDPGLDARMVSYADCPEGESEAVLEAMSAAWRTRSNRCWHRSLRCMNRGCVALDVRIRIEPHRLAERIKTS
jgi:hypothetical protein